MRRFTYSDDCGNCEHTITLHVPESVNYNNHEGIDVRCGVCGHYDFIRHKHARPSDDNQEAV